MRGRFFSIPVYSGEIWISDLSGLGSDENTARKLLIESEAHIRKPANSLRVALDVFDTNLTGDLVRIMANSLISMQKNIKKLAIKGASRIGKFHLRRYLKRANVEIPIKYFEDYEELKKWLISETY
jgi:hypothetical protein